MGNKKSLKNSSWKFWLQTLQTQVQQISWIPTENYGRGSVTFKEKGFLLCTEIKILKYKSGQIDKTEPQHLM